MSTYAGDLTGIFDSHAHYDSEVFAPDGEELLQNFPQNGVCAVVNIGCNLLASSNSIALAEKFPHVYASVGIHPGELDDLPADYIDTLREYSAHPKVVAIGEIGLDYHFKPYDKAAQMRVFREQMQLAQEVNLPVIIHSRDATADTLTVLREFPKVTGVVHCFSGSAETAREVLNMGYYIGFTGVVTFKNAEKTRRAASVVPMDKLLLETDAPYMAPEPHRGSRCQSDMIAFTAKAVAEVHNLPAQTVVDAARENTCRLFGITLEQ